MSKVPAGVVRVLPSSGGGKDQLNGRKGGTSGEQVGRGGGGGGGIGGKRGGAEGGEGERGKEGEGNHRNRREPSGGKGKGDMADEGHGVEGKKEDDLSLWDRYMNTLYAEQTRQTTDSWLHVVGPHHTVYT